MGATYYPPGGGSTPGLPAVLAIDNGAVGNISSEVNGTFEDVFNNDGGEIFFTPEGRANVSVKSVRAGGLQDPINDLDTVIPVADSTYTVGIGLTQNGTITTIKGLITSVQEAS